MDSASVGSRRWLAILVLIHVVAALYFAAVTPYRQSGVVRSQRSAPVLDVGAPDERQHVNYVQHLLDGKGFPVFNASDKDGLYETYQSHQPPLFYLLEAGWSKLTGFVSTDPESGKRLRWLNTLIGGSGVVGAFFLAWFATKREAISFSCAAFVALLPMNIALSGAVSNDPPLISLCTWALALLVRGTLNGWSTRDAAICGLLFGLACLTKTTALALIPTGIISYFIRKDVKTLAIVAGLTLFLAGGWWIRNQSLYGDPFAMKVFKEAFTGTAQASTFIQAEGAVGYWLSWVGWWTARSYLGAFGYMDIWLNETSAPVSTAPNALYRIWMAVVVIGFLGWLMHIRDAERQERQIHVLLGAFLAIVVILFVGFNMTYFQAQARYLFAALPVVGLGLALGQDAILKKRWPHWSEYVRSTAIVLPVVLVALLIAVAKVPEEFAKRVDSSPPASIEAGGTR